MGTPASRRRGSIRQRGSSFEIRAYIGRDPVTGKERTATVTVRGTRKQAERALTKMLAGIDEGKRSGTDATVGQLIDAWWNHNIGRWSPTTAAGYETNLRLHIRPELERLRVGHVTSEQLDRFYGKLAAKGLSPGTIAKIQTILSGMFTLARRWRWVDRSPVEDSDPPEVHVTEHPPPKPKLVRHILVELAASYADLALYLRLAAVTGARRGELCALRRSSLEDGVLTIDRGVIVVKGGTQVQHTKTHKIRRLPLDERTIELLDAHWETAEKLAADCGVTLADGYVFAYDAQRSRPWRPDGATARWSTARKTINGAEMVRIKDLRAYVGTQLSDARIPLPNTSKRLGHGKGGQTTLKHYAYAVTETDVAAAELLGGLLD